MDAGLRLLERCLQGFAGEEKYHKGFFYKRKYCKLTMGMIRGG